MLYLNRRTLLFFLFLCFFITSQSSLISLEFIPAADKKLTQRSKPLSIQEIRSENIQNLIKNMLTFSIYHATPNQTKQFYILLGLAAPQIGIMKRIIIINASKKKPPKPKDMHVLINPKIIWFSSSVEQLHENCYSVPEQLHGFPLRSKEITLEAYNQKGEKITRHYKGLLARIVQHEVDHLEGIRFPERLENETQLHILSSDADQIIYQKEWSHWPNYSSVKLWNEVKEGNYSSFELEGKI